MVTDDGILRPGITFVYGGVRSGKSSYAEKLARSCKGTVAYVATAQAHDDEMRQRIRMHQDRRPENWTLVEEPLEPAAAFRKTGAVDAVLLDCLGLYVSNMLCAEKDDDAVLSGVRELLDAAAAVGNPVIIVSNDVGAGVVPPSEMGRRFRDLLGFANQEAAKRADTVIMMQVGIPLRIKG